MSNFEFSHALTKLAESLDTMAMMKEKPYRTRFNRPKKKKMLDTALLTPIKKDDPLEPEQSGKETLNDPTIHKSLYRLAASLDALVQPTKKASIYETDDSGQEAETMTEEEHQRAKEEAYRTQTTRTALSAPLKILEGKGVFTKLPKGGRVLDYGCGKCSEIDTLLAKYPDLYITGYEVHAKQRPEFAVWPKGKFDMIYCNYVLNVISDRGVRYDVIEKIRSLLKPSGKAFITVRDEKKDLNGVVERTGQWQGRIKLKLPLVYAKTGNYMIYGFTKNDIEQFVAQKGQPLQQPEILAD